LKLARTKEWRESHGLTQRELAAEAGVGEVTIARIETGASVTPPTARKVSEALGVSVADLLERPPVPLAEAPTEPPDLEQRREYTQRLMDAGISEPSARAVSGELSRSEEYWRALAKSTGLSEASSPPEAQKSAEAPETEPLHHVRRPNDPIEVSDDVKIRLEEQFNALIHDLETIRRNSEAAELVRVRDELLEALASV
jgi:transcriptional regulator with XRE-family HTH domain